MQLKLALTLTLALALTACEAGSAFDTDPSAWRPLGTPMDAAVAAPGDGGIVFDDRCRELPPYDESVVISATGAVSHFPGQPCLEGCHQPGGEARSVFAVGGTVFRSQTSRVVAESGAVNVGGTLLPVDACGNIYAKEEELAGSVASTPPYIPAPTRRRMDKSLANARNPGSCNQSTCHDFSSRIRWGIYF